MDIKQLISSFFIIILLMFSNYLYELFPKQLGKLLTKNILIKHVALLFLIFFSIELADEEFNISPFQKLYHSLIIYVFYIFFNKSTLYFSILILLLLATNYIIIKQQTFLKNNGDEYEYLDKPIEIINWVIFAVMVVSFMLYFNKQLIENEKFSIYEFIFGTKIKYNYI